MKSILTLLLLFTLYTSSYAQYIVVEDRIWSEASFASEGNEVETRHRTFFGDTIVNNKNYKRIYYSWSLKSNNWLLSNDLIREVDGKVYKRKSTGKEELLYDFSLEVGGEYYDGDKPTPYYVDSIVVRNIQGQDLKHYYLSQEFYLPLMWVEKYGSFYGVFNYANTAGAIFVLLCVEDQGELIYENENYQSCEINGEYTSLDEKVMNRLKLYSVGNNAVQVQNHELKKGMLSFFTFEGSEVLKAFISDLNTQLCLPGSGLYVYRFESDNAEIETGKVMVK